LKNLEIYIKIIKKFLETIFVNDMFTKQYKCRQQQQKAQQKWQITSATIVTDEHSNGFLSNLDKPHERNLSSRIQDQSKITFNAVELKNSTKKYRLDYNLIFP